MKVRCGNVKQSPGTASDETSCPLFCSVWGYNVTEEYWSVRILLRILYVCWFFVCPFKSVVWLLVTTLLNLTTYYSERQTYSSRQAAGRHRIDRTRRDVSWITNFNMSWCNFIFFGCFASVLGIISVPCAVITIMISYWCCITVIFWKNCPFLWLQKDEPQTCSCGLQIALLRYGRA